MSQRSHTGSRLRFVARLSLASKVSNCSQFYALNCFNQAFALRTPIVSDMAMLQQLSKVSAYWEKRPMHPSRHWGYDARLGRSDELGARTQVCAFRIPHRNFSVRSILADSSHGYSGPNEGLPPAPQVVSGPTLGSPPPPRY